MINQKSITAVEKSCFGSFCRPLYDSYSFARIPGTVQKLLIGGEGQALPSDVFLDKVYDNVILILIDCFGWRFFEKYASRFPFLSRFVDSGIVSKLTSQFPSTTANHITCMHTGLSVGQSGVYEWFYYSPIVDDVISPFRFAYADDTESNTLLAKGFTPEELFDMRPIYPQLERQGIRSCLIQPKDIINSPYSSVMQCGAEIEGFKHLSEGLNKLKNRFIGASGKNYLYLYYPAIDTLCHSCGPDSPEVEKLIIKTFTQLEKFFQLVAGKKQKTALILTADHGMTSLDPAKRLCIHQLLPSLKERLKKTRTGVPIGCCGSSRDLFLHVEESHLAATQKELKERLSGIAEVFLTQELVDEGLFGLQPLSKRFLDRVGNLVILPYAPLSIWCNGEEKTPFKGHHGGLSREEMETIFLFQEI